MQRRTYNEGTDLVLGEELFLFIDGVPVAYATSANLAISADSIDTSSKMSGVWKASMPGQLGYTLSSESLLSRTEGHNSFDTLLEMMAKRAPIEFAIGGSEGRNTDSTTDQFAFDPAKAKYRGEAVITSLDLRTEVGSVCSSSTSLTGVGALINAQTGVPVGEAA